MWTSEVSLICNLMPSQPWRPNQDETKLAKSQVKAGFTFDCIYSLLLLFKGLGSRRRVKWTHHLHSKLNIEDIEAKKHVPQLSHDLENCSKSATYSHTLKHIHTASHKHTHTVQKNWLPCLTLCHFRRGKNWQKGKG